MINIEEEVFSIISTAVRAEYPKIYMVGEYVKSPSAFPCVSLIEMNNEMYEKTQSNDNLENHVSVMYEVNVYSNKTVGKKKQCKEIANFIDKQFSKLGFTRTMLKPIPNMEDATIYRMIGRYTAVVSNDNVIYRR